MKRLINWLFPQYQPVFAISGEWGFKTKDGEMDYIVKCSYEILYSERLGKFKLKCYGSDPKLHVCYGEIVVPKLNELKRNLSNV